MKPFNYLLAACCGVLALSCNDEKKTTETVVVTDTPATMQQVAQASATEGVATSIMIADVPDSVKTSFSVKYPKATATEWKKYSPAADDDLNMDAIYYYVYFMNGGANSTAWYDNSGNWVKTSSRIPGDSRLPDAVNKTLNEQFPGYKIDEIDKENDKDMDMYEIKLKKGDQKANLKILPNGTIFKKKIK